MFQRKFVSEVKRCDDVLRQLRSHLLFLPANWLSLTHANVDVARFLRGEMVKCGLHITEPEDDTVHEPASSDLTDIEVCF